MLHGITSHDSVVGDIPGLHVTKLQGRPVKIRKTYLLHGLTPGHQYLSYNPSISSAERAIKERLFCVKTGEIWSIPEVPDINLVRRTLRKFKDAMLKFSYRKHPLSHEQFAMCYHGPRRRRYLQAATDLNERVVNKKDSHISFFLKFETYNFNIKSDPSPRGINPREDRYLVSAGCYLHPIENEIYKNIEKVFGYKVVLKGTNQKERGELISKYWSEVDDPVSLSFDASKFEQSIDVPYLEFEHDIYKSYYKGDRKLAKLLRWQMDNIGRFKCKDGKLFFKIKGKRMSGDKNTAMGNCLISSGMGYSFINHLVLLAKFKFVSRFFCDGDDAVIIIPRKILNLLKTEIDPWYKKRGFRMVAEKPAFVLEKLEFCQSQPVFDGKQYIMVRNPIRSLSKDSVSKTSLTSERSMKRWVKAVGLCGISVSGGMPILQSYYNCLIRSGGNVKAYSMDHPGIKDYTSYKVMGMKRKTSSISNETRVSFWLAFGISPSSQEAIELFYENQGVIKFTKEINIDYGRSYLPW